MSDTEWEDAMNRAVREMGMEGKVTILPPGSRPGTASQPAPRRPAPDGAARLIRDLVIEDLTERCAEGTRKYGTPLTAGNGRDALTDAYQEALDLAMYLRQAIEERDS